MTELLAIRKLSVRFGGVHAVDDVDLTVQPGEVVGLIGPNGAGKTTLLDAITGFVPSTGQVRLSDHDITDLPAHRRVHAGLSRTWQSIDLFDDLTVRENLEVAVRDSATDPIVDRALAQLGIDGLASCMPSELSHAERKLVGIARALASGPAVVCMDEPAAGLDESSGRDLAAGLRSLANRGTSVLLVEHNMALVLGVCDRIYVLNFGRVIAAGEPAVIRTDRSVVEAYLGDESVSLS